MINIENKATMWNRMMYPFDVPICARLSQIQSHGYLRKADRYIWYESLTLVGLFLVP